MGVKQRRRRERVGNFRRWGGLAEINRFIRMWKWKLLIPPSLAIYGLDCNETGGCIPSELFVSPEKKKKNMSSHQPYPPDRARFSNIAHLPGSEIPFIGMSPASLRIPSPTCTIGTSQFGTAARCHGTVSKLRNPSSPASLCIDGVLPMVRTGEASKYSCILRGGKVLLSDKGFG